MGGEDEAGSAVPAAGGVSYLPLPDWIILFVAGVVIGIAIGYARTHPRRP